MKYFRLPLFLLLSLTGMSPAFGQSTEKLTLKNAEQIALKNHPLLRAAEFSASAANAGVTQARSAYYPFAFGDVTGVGAEHNSRIAAGGLSNPVIFDRFAQGLVVSQTVTDFGRTQNLVASSSLHAQAETQGVAQTRADLLLAVDRAYFAALEAQAVLQVATRTVEQRQLILDRVTALEQGKLKSELDVRFASVDLAEAKLFLVQATNNVQAAYASLSTALGYPDAHSFEIGEEPLPAPPPSDPAPLVAIALQQRPELVRQRLEVQSAQHYARAERDLWLPTLSAFGAAGLIPLRQDTLTSRFAAGGINLTIPLFNGHLYGSLAAEAIDRAAAESQALRDAQDRVARDVRLAWLQADASYRRLSLTAELFSEASQALDLAQARYDLGLSSIVELSQAQLNLTQAQIEQARAKYQYESDFATLSYELGQLR